jgi:hypothetical protein
MRCERGEVQAVRMSIAAPADVLGMLDARTQRMRADETWTIPLHIIMWTTFAVGLIMAMAVIMMH